MDKSLARLAVIVPITHVVACSIFLAGYSWGFGGKVGTLFSVTDFFTVSLDRLIMIYLCGLGIPLGMIFYRHRTGEPYASVAIARETDETKKQELIRRRRSRIRALTVLMWFAGVTGLSAFILSIAYDLYRSYYALFSAMLFSMSILWWKLAEKAKLDGIGAEFAWTVTWFVVSLVGIGMDAGFRDRRMTFDYHKSAHYRCGTHIILTPAGDRFISVTPDNRRHVINEECKDLFEFASAPPPSSETIFSAIAQTVRGWLSPRMAPTKATQKAPAPSS